MSKFLETFSTHLLIITFLLITDASDHIVKNSEVNLELSCSSICAWQLDNRSTNSSGIPTNMKDFLRTGSSMSGKLRKAKNRLEYLSQIEASLYK